MSQRFPRVTPAVWQVPLSLFASEVLAYLVRVECLYMIKPMVVNFGSVGRG